ncbi:MAG: putative Histidine kinase [Candidatus Saccharibacteria bacterium]|nr:putative Histidine kinase [Candidatus Saccharibacteria bacterium]
MFRSATFKLTMSYLAIIAIISIGFSIGIYQVASRDLEFGLQRQTERITNHFPVFSGSPYLHSEGADLRESRDHLVGRLIALNAVVLIGAGFASYALARRTLGPIEEAHERQKRFTADVSHELRTPLTALKMESEVALMDPTASKTELREVIGSNIEEAEKLNTLVANLLRLSQLDDADRAEVMNVMPLNDAVQAAIDQMQTIATNRNIHLNASLDDKLQVRGDQPTLTQLFVILLDNALKYSPAGSEVSVTTSAKQQLAQITITDHGVGIAKADLDHVFERFYRADQARTASDSSGYGLGLSIAKLIADSHNATVSLTSRVGKGTTAIVAMPIPEPAPVKP